MSRYRSGLPQLSGDLFLADAGFILDSQTWKAHRHWAKDLGDPEEFGRQYRNILQRMPWLNIFGGCCGSDLRHVTQIARAISQGKK